MASSFSGSTGRNTATWTAQQAQQQRDELMGIYGNTYNQAQSRLQPAYNTAQGYLGAGYNTAANMLRQSSAQAGQTLQNSQNQQIGATTGGYGDALRSLQQGYGQAAGVYQPLYDQNMAGFGMYQNSLGLGGAEGTAAAQQAFTAGPGYQWQQDQAVKGAQRAASKVGGLYSGNTNDQVTRLSSNLANQEFGNWQKNLSGFQQGAQNAAQGLSSIYAQQGAGEAGLYSDQAQRLSQIYGQGGAAQAGLQQGTGAAIAQMRNQYGSDQANLRVGEGQGLANLDLNYGANQAGAVNQYYQTLIPAGQQGFQAGQTARSNINGAIMGGLQVGAQVLGGAFGGGAGAAGAGAGAGAAGGAGGGMTGFGTFLKGLFG